MKLTTFISFSNYPTINNICLNHEQEPNNYPYIGFYNIGMLSVLPYIYAVLIVFCLFHGEDRREREREGELFIFFLFHGDEREKVVKRRERGREGIVETREEGESDPRYCGEEREGDLGFTYFEFGISSTVNRI